MKCVLCGSHRVKELADLPAMPLCILDLVDEPDLGKPRYPFQICHCQACGHVYNGKYCASTNQVFYGGCTMYNAGKDWKEHMKDVANLILREKVTEGARLIEIGAGHGEFTSLLKEENITAYEPSVDSVICATRVPTVQRFFTGEELIKVRPDVLIMRHVLEHFADPRAFLEELSEAAVKCAQPVTFYIEVPNIEKALEAGRLEDWVYEHPQHYTPESLSNLLEISGWHCCQIDRLYDEEVMLATAYVADTYSRCDLGGIQKSIDDLYSTCGALEGPFAFWGGTGKSSQTINLMVGPMRKFVTVVDSDYRKWGKYVPGTNHLIQSPEILRTIEPGDIIITTTWRTKDIVAEIKANNIPHTRLLNLVGGQLKETNV